MAARTPPPGSQSHEPQVQWEVPGYWALSKADQEDVEQILKRAQAEREAEWAKHPPPKSRRG